MESSSATPLTASAATTETNAKRNSNDVGWEYGVLAESETNRDKVRCLLCKKSFSGGVHRLKQHIALVRGSVTPCPVSTIADQIKCRDALNEIQKKKKGKKDGNESLRAGVDIETAEHETITIEDDAMEGSFGSAKAQRSFGPMDRFANNIKPEDVLNTGKSKNENLSSVFRKEQMIRVKEYICRWAYECAIPFHAFERDSFKLMLEAVGQFGRGVEPPTRYEMGETYLKKEVERTKTFLTPFKDEWKSSGCSIMTDAWSDIKRRSIMNLCVNSPLGTVFLSSKESSDDAHTSEHIHEYVEGCIKEVGPENVVQIVTDNASNNMGAAKLLETKRPTIFWTSCATHTINLMLEGIGGLQKFQKILTKAKALSVFIYAHPKTLAMMRRFTKRRDIVRPGVTRFASSFLTLQSLADKKTQLKEMFNCHEWDNSKFYKTVKGEASRKTVMNNAFWSGVALCLKVFGPLVKVLRMVDADWKPSMGFIYGEIKKAEQEIMDALSNNEREYGPILDIISKKMKNRLDTKLHMTAYLLNPYYLYNNSAIKDDIDVMDAIIDFVGKIYPGDHTLQNHIVTVELPIYMGKQEKFSREMAIKGCEVNGEKFDPANWWRAYGASTPELRKNAIRILSLTTSSLGCERNWSTFEGVHTKKRNRLEASKLNQLVFVQFNANLMEKNKKRKTKGMELLLASDAKEAQDWIVEDELEPEPNEAEGDDDEPLEDRRSARLRELEEDFVSEEEELNDTVEYESNGVNINEQDGAHMVDDD
ncbi:hypothetical protein SSX86_033175 [Deinandra increscens subsp. villosa]|uniref:BED-type domain-containing protein n=1 Tax=Deinandra increscens subsp. villosa TaxID=3103831 RepID=A0AAP0GG59_9ASTR